MRTKTKVFFTTLVVLLLLVTITGIALALDISLKQTTLGQQDTTCQEGRDIVLWHFVINQLAAPVTSIHVYWDNGNDVVVTQDKFTGGVSHFTTESNPGALVVDATTVVPDGWTGEFNLSHVECEPPDPLGIDKTANPSYTRTWDWAIVKDYDWDYVGFAGDVFTHDYIVSVDPTFEDDGWEVNGTITITNPNGWAISGLDISDNVDNGGVCNVDPYDATIAAEATLEVDYTCTYAVEPSPAAGTNTAEVSYEDYDVTVYSEHTHRGFEFTDPTTEIDPVISVDDDNLTGEDWSAERAFASWSYDKDFACPTDTSLYTEGKYEMDSHVNTATIVETGDSDIATLDLTCYILQVSKDAFTSFTRTYDWSIDKSADESALTLATGEVFTVTYDVVLDAYYVDSDWAVEGSITIHNPAPITATINSVTDYVSGDSSIPAAVDCDVTFPYELAAYTDLVCTYAVDLPDANPRTNSASATLQNTPSGTTNFSGYANVSFTGATIAEIDECVNVEDSFAGALGTVCYHDLPVKFTYTRDIGPYEVCDDYTVYNLATALTNDTSALTSDSWTVNVTVPCPGCTLTQGYWKTHSSIGPAPYDDNWAGMENSTFYLSGKNWYQVFWTPSVGNAYYILAHQYMAAKLNIGNGASSTPGVDAAIAYAEDFFESSNPITKLSKSDKAAVIFNAGILGSYNEGLIGPGHCSE